MVFGRGANHRGAADVDILDALLEGGALVDRGLEWIEINHQQIDRGDAMVLHRLRMLGIVADREQAAMNLGMQGLDPSIHHFRKGRELRDIPDRQPRLGDLLGGASRGDQFDAVTNKRAGEVDQSGLVRNGQQGAIYAARVVGHGGVLQG